MNCPVCGGPTKVADTRSHEDHICRTRRCLDCDHHFYTVEVDEDMLRNLTKEREEAKE